MKKQYIKPTIEIIRISYPHMIATSNPPTTLRYGGSNEEDGPTVAESNSFFGGITENEVDERFR
ncbi:MAG: hypothetical protein ACI4TS_07390 [Bacteroidaceae bacterium]